MRKWITFLMTFLVGSVTSANAYVDDSQVSFEAGYRHDSLNWTAEFPSDDPLFKQTHKFKDLDIFLLALNAKTNLGCNFYFRGTADWGWVLDGESKETLQTYESGSDSVSRVFGDSGSKHDNIVDGRYVFDVSGAFGYPFYFCNCSMFLAPTVGYTFNEQNLWVESDSNFELSERDSFLVPVSGSEGCCCRHKFVSRWYGPFVGLDWEYKPCGECWNLFAQLEYHWAQFNGKRNARAGFSGFDHFKTISHHAHGWVGAFGFNYDINHCWAVGLTARFRRMVSSKNHHYDGSDSSFSSFISSDASNRIKSHVHWTSYEIGVEVVRAF